MQRGVICNESWQWLSLSHRGVAIISMAQCNIYENGSANGQLAIWRRGQRQSQ
jgi:hypothetical protein